MHPIEELNLKQVSLFKNVLHGVVEGFEKSGVEFQLLAIAVAAEEFAAELRRQSADDFKNCPPISFPRSAAVEEEDKPKSYPEWIGGE